ncbi:hypothetical protein D3C86_2148310 [compost metagenome]
MHRAGDGDLLLAGLHELEDGHLGRGVLHDDPVDPELEIALAGLQLLRARIVEVREEDLLGQGQRPLQAIAHDR